LQEENISKEDGLPKPFITVSDFSSWVAQRFQRCDLGQQDDRL
jgi:hypothetical protein